MKANKMEVAFNIKSVDDAGRFTGYASVFDVIDSYRDVVKKGAFQNSIATLKEKNRKLPILWMHDSSKPLGVYDEIKEDDHGLYVEGRLLINDVVQAKEAHALMKAGAVTGMSIGYYLKKHESDQDKEIWNLTEVDLFETSLVTFPACDEARIIDVKSKLQNGELPTLKEFEKFLRESGFSRTQAAAIANNGLSKLHKEQSESVSVKETLNDVLRILKGIEQ